MSVCARTHGNTHVHAHTCLDWGDGGDGQEEWAGDVVRLVLHTCALGSIPSTA